MTTTTAADSDPTPTTILRVTGMTCGHCARTLERAAGSVPGADGARADLGAGTLTVQGRLDRHALVQAVLGTGYGVEES